MPHVMIFAEVETAGGVVLEQTKLNVHDCDEPVDVLLGHYLGL
jgi:hypothetical protein